MTCANWMLTILSVVTFAFAVWPGNGAVGATRWIVGICMLLVFIISWTIVECKCGSCKTKEVTRGPIRKKVVRRRR
ncbi:MAG: hypothetical protein NUV97_01750 [archaeon]|nr:hypothetical protein [archaeon]MCR4323677.1 hypothetical protein [Nanoarchaeota archaeon]